MEPAELFVPHPGPQVKLENIYMFAFRDMLQDKVKLCRRKDPGAPDKNISQATSSRKGQLGNHCKKPSILV
jgi:hypothetical protein